MSYFDDHEDYIIYGPGRLYGRDEPSEPKSVTCKRCGAKGLWWFPEKRGRYLLKNPDGSQHDCRNDPAAIANEFEDLTK
jgi:hypothetical protein